MEGLKNDYEQEVVMPEDMEGKSADEEDEEVEEAEEDTQVSICNKIDNSS